MTTNTTSHLNNNTNQVRRVENEGSKNVRRVRNVHGGYARKNLNHSKIYDVRPKKAITN